VTTYPHALDALGEPTRRRVFELLRDGPLAVGELAAQLPVSRPAVSQHLRVLETAGLVTFRRAGTRRLYEVDPQGLHELRAWVDDFWSEALARYQAAADRRGASA
jgi:DNA-binding transcriptional ArsR family regulator